MDVRKALMGVRNLRLLQYGHANIAAEYLHRAGNGVTPQRALDIGGTGNCPLTDYADLYDNEHKMALKAKREADAIWATITPMMDGIDYDTQCVIDLYYNQGADMQDVARSVKRSLAACEKMQAHVCLTLRMEEG